MLEFDNCELSFVIIAITTQQRQRGYQENQLELNSFSKNKSFPQLIE